MRTELVVDKLAQDYARYFTIESYRWEYEPMLASGHFQDAIEPPSTADIVILLLWSRLGTPLPARTPAREYQGLDGRVPVTGTEWEYEDALAQAQRSGVPDILAFRNTSPVAIEALDGTGRREALLQLEALDRFWSRHFKDRGVFLAGYEEYRDLEHFSQRLELLLGKLLERRIAERQAEASERAIWLSEPFRGLATYELQHAAIFFGRDGAVARAAESVAAAARAGRPFLLISGPSGSGKSSLVRAALIPRLMKPQRIVGTALLRAASFRPSDAGDPFLGLADALAGGRPDGGEGLPELLGPGQTYRDLAEHLRSSAHSPGFAFKAALGKVADEARRAGRLLVHEEVRLIVFVDQFEEIFTAAQVGDDDRATFARLLKSLVAADVAWVVAAIRSDFWHRLAEVAELRDLMQGESHFVMAAPTSAELVEIIRKPAQAAGIAFESHPDTGVGLDSLLAEHAAAQPGVLPLLSFTLDELYRRDVVAQGHPRLTYASYAELGGLEGAIATRAEAVVDALPATVRDALPQLFRALVTVKHGEAQVAVARSVAIDAFPLGSLRRSMLDALVTSRLVVASAEGDAPMVRIAHEALLTRWARVREQLVRDRRDLETRDLVERQQARWEGARGRDRRQLLLRNPDLANAIDLEQRWRDDLDPNTIAFVQASRRGAQTQRRLFAVALAVFALVAAAALFSWYAEVGQRVRAEAATSDAVASAAVAKASQTESENQLAAAQRSESLSLAEQAIREADNGDIAAALADALRSLPKDLGKPDRPYLRKAEFALAKAVLADRLKLALQPGWDRVNNAIFAPDGKTVATATRDGIVALWDATTGRLTRRFDDRRNAVLDVAFSPDGRRIATYTQFPATALVRDVATGETLWDLPLSQATPGRLLFTPDGERLIAVTNQGDTRPRVWDLRTGIQSAILDDRSHDPLRSIETAAMAADGRFLTLVQNLLLNGQGAVLDVWDPVTSKTLLGAEDKTLPADANAPWDVTAQIHAINPDDEMEGAQFLEGGRKVAIRGKTTIYVFDVDTRHLDSHATFSTAWNIAAPKLFYVLPDGRALIGLSETQVAVVDVADGRAIKTFSAHFLRYSAWAVSPDATQLSVATQDNGVHVWDLGTGDELFVLRGATSGLQHLAYSPDGERLMASPTPKALVWDVRPNAKRFASPGSHGGAEHVDASGTYALIKSADFDGPGRLVNLSTGTLIRELSCDVLSEAWFSTSPDGSRVVWRCGDPSSAGSYRYRILDAKSGSVLGDVSIPEGKDDEEQVALSPDGQRLAIASRVDTGTEDRLSRVRVWSVAERRELLVIQQDGDEPAAFFEDGGRLVVKTASSFRSTRITAWDLASGTRLSDFEDPGAPIDTSGSGLLASHDRLVLGSSSIRPVLREASTGQALGNVAGKAIDINGVSISPAQDGRVLVGRMGSPWTLWDLSSRRMLASVPGPDTVGSAVFDEGGGRILARSGGNLAIHDAASGALIKAFGSFDGVFDAYIGWSGKRIVVQIAPDVLEVRDAAGDAPPRRLTLAGRLYRWTMADADERLLVADQNGAVSLWNLATGEQMPGLAGIHGGEPFSFATGGARRRAVKLASGGLMVLDTESGRTIWQGEAGRVIEEAVLSPDEARLAVADSGSLAIYRLDTGADIFALPLERGRAVAALAFDAGSTRLVAKLAPAGVLLIDAVAGTILSRLDDADRLAFQGRPVAATSHDGTLTVFEVATGRVLRTALYPQALRNIEIDETGRFVATATSDGKVAVLDMTTGEQKPVVTLPAIPHEIHFGADSGEVLIFDNDPLRDHGELTLRQVATGQVITRFEAAWPVHMGLASWWLDRADPSGAFVAIATPDSRINVFRSLDGSQIANMFWTNEQFADLAFSKAGDVLLGLTTSGNVAIWQTGGKLLATLRGLGTFTQFPPALTPLPDAGRFLAVDTQGRVSVIALASQTWRAFFSGVAEPGLGADLSKDGLLLATFSKTGMVRVWDTAVGAVLFQVAITEKREYYKPGVQFADDGRRIVISNADSPVAIIELPPAGQALVARAAASVELARSPTEPAAAARAYRLGVVTGVDPRGPVVLDVFADSPALEAGVRLGDVIVAVDGRKVTSPSDVIEALKQAGGAVVLDLIRAGVLFETKIVLPKRV